MTKTNKNKSGKIKKKMVSSLIKQIASSNVEIKHFDQSSAAAISVSGLLVNVSDITRGDDVTQRIGNQVSIKNIHLKVTWTLGTNATAQRVRTMIVVDKQGFNTPVVTDIIDTSFVGGGGGYSSIGYYYWDYRKRFKVIYDHVSCLTSSGSNQTIHLDRKASLNLKSQYIGASTTFTNQVYLLFIADDSNVLDFPACYYSTRITFTDE